MSKVGAILRYMAASPDLWSQVWIYGANMVIYG